MVLRAASGQIYPSSSLRRSLEDKQDDPQPDDNTPEARDLSYVILTIVAIFFLIAIGIMLFMYKYRERGRMLTKKQLGLARIAARSSGNGFGLASKKIGDGKHEPLLEQRQQQQKYKFGPFEVTPFRWTTGPDLNFDKSKSYFFTVILFVLIIAFVNFGILDKTFAIFGSNTRGEMIMDALVVGPPAILLTGPMFYVNNAYRDGRVWAVYTGTALAALTAWFAIQQITNTFAWWYHPEDGDMNTTSYSLSSPPMTDLEKVQLWETQEGIIMSLIILADVLFLQLVCFNKNDHQTRQQVNIDHLKEAIKTKLPRGQRVALISRRRVPRGLLFMNVRMSLAPFYTESQHRELSEACAFVTKQLEELRQVEIDTAQKGFGAHNDKPRKARRSCPTFKIGRSITKGIAASVSNPRTRFNFCTAIFGLLMVSAGLAVLANLNYTGSEPAAVSGSPVCTMSGNDLSSLVCKPAAGSPTKAPTNNRRLQREESAWTLEGFELDSSTEDATYNLDFTREDSAASSPPLLQDTMKMTRPSVGVIQMIRPSVGVIRPSVGVIHPRQQKRFLNTPTQAPTRDTDTLASNACQAMQIALGTSCGSVCKGEQYNGTTTTVKQNVQVFTAACCSGALDCKQLRNESFAGTVLTVVGILIMLVFGAKVYVISRVDYNIVQDKIAKRPHVKTLMERCYDNGITSLPMQIVTAWVLSMLFVLALVLASFAVEQMFYDILEGAGCVLSIVQQAVAGDTLASSLIGPTTMFSEMITGEWVPSASIDLDLCIY
jgi:hypothetical protein